MGGGAVLARRLGVLPWMLAAEVVAVALVRVALLRRAASAGRLDPVE